MPKFSEYGLYGWMRALKLNKTQVTVILAGVYIFMSLVANVAATKVMYLGKLVMDAGIIYSLTFTWRDLIHKQLGKRIALTTIYLSAIVNVLAALYFQLVVFFPPEAQWAAAGGQIAWKFIFGIQLRVVLGSVLAMVVSEIVDTQVYHYWTTGYGKDKPQFFRVLVSNGIAVPVDSLIFPIVAFLGVVDWNIIWIMFVTNILVKFAITLASFWMIYLVPDKPIYVSNE